MFYVMLPEIVFKKKIFFWGGGGGELTVIQKQTALSKHSIDLLFKIKGLKVIKPNSPQEFLLTVGYQQHISCSNTQRRCKEHWCHGTGVCMWWNTGSY